MPYTLYDNCKLSSLSIHSYTSCFSMSQCVIFPSMALSLHFHKTYVLSFLHFCPLSVMRYIYILYVLFFFSASSWFRFHGESIGWTRDAWFCYAGIEI